MSVVFRFTVVARCSSGSDMLKNLKYTAERVNKITHLLRKGVTCNGEALVSGVGECTFHKWKREKPTFAAAVEQAIGESEANLV